MKKLILLSLGVALIGGLNVGCRASASVGTTDNTKLPATVQAAYVTSPSK